MVYNNIVLLNHTEMSCRGVLVYIVYCIVKPLLQVHSYALDNGVLSLPFSGIVIVVNYEITKVPVVPIIHSVSR